MTDTTYPADAGAATYLLTVRGTTVPSTLDETRDIHNSTAGAPQSAAGARSLGDLSHNVYAPIGKDRDGELLFIDLWNSVSGLGTSSPTRRCRRRPVSCSPSEMESCGRPSTASVPFTWRSQGPLDWRRGPDPGAGHVHRACGRRVHGIRIHDAQPGAQLRHGEPQHLGCASRIRAKRKPRK